MLAKSLFLSSSFFRGASALALSSTLFACVIEEAPPRKLGGSDTPTPTAPYNPGSGGAGGTSGSTGTPPTDTSPSPMLVVVDTDQVMNADPGQGVGVFAEYAAGGKWHIWWTCDTAKSQLPCDVVVSATAASGTIDGLTSEELQGGFATSPEPSRVEARSSITNQVNGIRFNTTPGATITLEATIGGLKEGPGPNRSFFFFVQDGKINGGYTGTLTNPLQLQGKAP